MLVKEMRLDPKKIPFIAKKGKKIENDYFITRVWFDDRLLNPFFAISISTKIDKRAVLRNRIKRRFRAVINEIVAENEVIKANFLFIIKNKELKNIDFNKFKDLVAEVIVENKTEN